MHEELSLEILTPTVRLAQAGWAAQIERACDAWKAAGARRGEHGVRVLVGRMKRSRPSTYAHCVRVARSSRLIGRAFGFDGERLRQVALTAMMHDIGKLLVPDSILERPRRPNFFERYVLNRHPSFGAALAYYYGLPAALRVRTQHHHERWDGLGYPHGLGGEDIPLMARIVQVADSFDAMTEQRAYNSPRAHDDAVAELRRESGRQFDPKVVEAFLDTLPEG